MGDETPESKRRSSAQSREKYRVTDGEMTDFQKFMLEKLLTKFSLMGKYMKTDNGFLKLNFQIPTPTDISLVLSSKSFTKRKATPFMQGMHYLNECRL